MKHKGFTLIEMVLVLAIIAILYGSAVAAFHYLAYTDGKKCTSEINTVLKKLRLDTMSQGELNRYLVIEWDNTKKSYYYCIATDTNELDQDNWETEADKISGRKKLASEKVKISYTDRTDGMNLIYLRDEKELLINYYSDSGAFKSNCRQIQVASGNRVYSINLVQKTGKVYVK